MHTPDFVQDQVNLEFGKCFMDDIPCFGEMFKKIEEFADVADFIHLPFCPRFLSQSLESIKSERHTQFSVDHIFHELVHIFYGEDIRCHDCDPFVGEQECVDDIEVAATPDIEKNKTCVQLAYVSEKLFLLREGFVFLFQFFEAFRACVDSRPIDPS